MEITSSEIGVGILTYNRPEYYLQVLKSIPRDQIGSLVVVNDGTNVYVTPDKSIDYIFINGEQKGVAKSKNLILKSLKERGCKHLFIIEDDILIKKSDVFKQYIRAAYSTGIHHLCYEKVADNGKNLRFVLEQSDGVKVGFYSNPQGAFMYFNSSIIDKLGVFDENYINAFEHIDFAYNLDQKNVAPPFWYFPDLLNSEEYLSEIPGSNENSSISNRENYNKNWEISAQYFTRKWGKFTTGIEDIEPVKFLHKLIDLQKNYHRKKNLNINKKLSIIIPYRNRQQALDQIIPSLHNYVSTQVENYEILVIEQNDDKPFNKGLLNNVGFTLCSGDYVCFHDVDLLPEFSDYSYPEKPSHISSHCSQFNYINIPDKIMGGVILFRKEHFERVNGYSNEYVGWGKEDDDLYERCVREDLTPYKHPFGKFFSVPHLHRLTNPGENFLHEKNGKRFQEFLNNPEYKSSHKTDGVCNCMSKVNSVKKLNNNELYTHYLINF